MMDFGLFLLFAAINDAELEEQERMRRQEEERKREENEREKYY